MITRRKQPLKCIRNMYLPLGDIAGVSLLWSKGNMMLDKSESDVLLGLRCFITAHRLATTEQSVVMSCTKSQSPSAATSEAFSLAGPDGAGKSSLGRFHPAKVSSCFSEKESKEASLNDR